MKRVMTLAVVSTLFLVSSVLAGTFNTKVNIGDRGANFEGLIGTDDESHSLADYKEAKLVVLCFTCNHCPVAKAYEDRFVEFVKQYKNKGVAFVAVNVNNNAADRLDKMKERAKQKRFNFDYLYDSSQKIGRDYGATVTPHLFILDRDRKIAYMGAFDDSKNPDNVKSRWVVDAVDALLASRKPEVTETRQFGCGIQYEGKGSGRKNRR